MRTRRTLSLLLLLPALALAQDRGKERMPAPTGRYLYAAMPARTDLLVHTPDLPALLASAEDEGVGSAKAWKGAFRAQMEAWGELTGAPELLVRGAERLLAAADGEAVVAGMSLPAFDAPPRATLFAFRTSHREKELRAAFADVLEGGLIASYPSGAQEEQIGGRPVTALTGVGGRLYVLIQDGLVAASDHPLALGLLFRGLERAEEPDPAGAMLLEARHGLGKTAWTGWTYGKRESVSWSASVDTPLSAPLAYGFLPVVAVALPAAADTPLLPEPAPEWFSDLPTGGPVGRMVAMTRKGAYHVMGAGQDVEVGVTDDGVQTVRVDGVWIASRGKVVVDTDLPRADAPVMIPGGATRLGWLRAWTAGRLAPPVAGIDRAHLLGPLTSAAEASTGKETFLPWKSTEQAGELRGPRWHGPTTFLALRALRDIVAKVKPGAETAAVTKREPPPLRTGGATLPPPVAPREGDDDGK